MSWAYDAVRLVHFAAGAVALIVFWVPAFTKKGGSTHRRAGRLYVRSMSVVIASALPLSASSFIKGDWVVGTFLCYLALITFTAVWSGRAVLNVKANASAFRTRFHAGVGVLNAVASAALLVIAWTVAPGGFARILFTVFSLIGISASVETWRFFRRPPNDPKWWWYEHFGGMIGSGIAAHTAFGAFGMRQILPDLLNGPLGLIPWIAPSVLGLSATALLTRHYRRKFAGGPMGGRPAAVARQGR